MKSKVLQRKMFRDPSEDENVGIMQGFMDSLEEMLGGEEDMSEEDDSPSGAPDRTPSSPEILMNTLRGDMRSVDARIDELADMVGYNAASSTPLEVLALLQPVLKQQGIAALPADSAMPPPPTGAPPSGAPVPPVPAQGGGIATLPQGDMGQGPPPVAMAEGGEVNPYSGYANPMSGGMTNPMNFQSQQLAGGGIAPYTGPMMTTGNYTGPMDLPEPSQPFGKQSEAVSSAMQGLSELQAGYKLAGTGGGVAPYTGPSAYLGGDLGVTGTASGNPMGLSKADLFAQGGMPPLTYEAFRGGSYTERPMDTSYSGPPQSNPLDNIGRIGGDMTPGSYNNPMTSPITSPYSGPPAGTGGGVTGITGTASGVDRMPADYGMPPPMFPSNAYSGPPAGTGGGMTSPMVSPMVSYPSPQPFQGGGGRPQNPMMAPKPSQFPMGGGPQQPQRKGPQQSQMRGPQQSPMGGGIGSLAQGNMGASPRLMAKGGIVQHFQNGSVGEDGVTQVDESSGITYSPEMMDAFRQRILSMAGRDAMRIPDLMQRTQELAPQYRTLLGVDPSATKSQMLFDVAQAALNYAGNVNAQGQPMRGSQAARLAGAASGLPAAIGARAAEAQKQNQAIRMAAMQGAQSEIDAVRATNTSREDTLDKMAIEAMKQKVSPRPMTPAEKTAYGITGTDASLPWFFNSTGQPTLAGGRPPVPLVDMGGGGKFSERANILAADDLNASKIAANSAMSTLNTISQIRPILNDPNSVISGTLGGTQQLVSRFADTIGIGGKTNEEKLNNTVAVMQNLAAFELEAAQALRGQGPITDNERALIKKAAGGDILVMSQSEVLTLIDGLEKQANYRISQHNAKLNNLANAFANDPAQLQSLNLFRLGDVPVMSAFPTSTQTPTTQPPSSNVTITPEAVAAEMARRAAGQ